MRYLQETEYILERPHKVEILAGAVRARDQTTVLAEELVATGFDDLPTARLAHEAPGTARNGGKDVVRVHCADDQGDARPWGPALEAGELVGRPAQTLHADGVEVQASRVMVVVVQRRRRLLHEDRVHRILVRREEERSVNERILVVDRECHLADDACDDGHLQEAEVRQDEAARLVVSVRTLILDLDLVRVLEEDR